MIKVLNQYFPGRLFVLLLTENALILTGVWLAISLHMRSLQISLLSDPALFGKALMVTAVCQICFYYADLYDLRTLESRFHMLTRLLQALGAASLILAILLTIFPQARLGAGIVESSLLVMIFVILLWRIVVEWLNRAYGAGERILLVGSGEAVHNLAREIRLRKDLPLTVVGAVAENAESTGGLGLPMVGTLDNIAQIIAEIRPSRVIIGLKERRQQLPINTLLRLRMRGLLIEQASTLYEKLTGKIPVQSIHPSALIFADGFRHSRRLRFYERFFGLAAALFALLLAGPVLAIVALAIKLDSRGPVFYRQSRVGYNGEPFDILKFRSMRVDAESGSGPVWASDRDPRVTRVGRILRLLRLDELPQLINVLYGEMSFIGPRPERPYFVDQLREHIPFYDLRHSVRPGITGWAQVRSRYGASVEDSKEKLEYDLFYIKNVSLSLDLLILFQTIKIVLFGRGAR